jgi:hypothetical protein
MPTLVEKLQMDAMDRNVSVSDLLRRVKLTSIKHGLSETADWVEHELSGYETNPPPYRILHGRPMGRHPLRGWIPIGGNTARLSQWPNIQPVAALEALLAQQAPNKTLHMPYPDEICAQLDQDNGVRGWSYRLEIPASELTRILDKVRTLVLDWALALEKAGIMGSEINFDAADRARASEAGTTINIGFIGQFAGSLGQGSISNNASLNFNVDTVLPIIDQLKQHVTDLVAAGAHSTLGDQLTELEVAVKQARPDSSKLHGLLTDVRNSLSGAAGNLLASGAMHLIGTLLK